VNVTFINTAVHVFVIDNEPGDIPTTTNCALTVKAMTWQSKSQVDVDANALGLGLDIPYSRVTQA